MSRQLLRLAAWLMRWSERPKSRWVGLAVTVVVVGSLLIGRFVIAADGPTPAGEAQSNISSAQIIAGLLAQLVLFLAQGVGQICVLLIGVVVIPLLQYNNFSTASFIGGGWAVVRDAVNMFFVILLIAIAFGTIFGVSKFQWRQQIPQLMIMAILINFSRTLCGLMIDFSQVIALTFAAALSDVAGGNFIQMLGMTSIFEANNAAEAFSASGGGISPFDTFMGAIAAFVMIMIILVTLMFLAIVLAYRIVILWTLVVLAPLCWFFKPLTFLGLKGNPYSMWWERFKCALQVGPIITFFLWLGLATAGGGSIAEAEFPAATAPPGEGLDSGSILQALTMPKLVSFIIGISIIFIGLDAAQQACSSEAGISQLLGQSKGYGKKIAAAPVDAARYVGAGAAYMGVGAARTGMRAGRAVGSELYRQTGGAIVGAGKQKLATQLERVAEATPGGLGTGFIKKQAAAAASGMRATRAAEVQESLKGKQQLTTDQLINTVKAGMPALGVESRNEHLARVNQLLNNEDALKALGSKGLAEVLGSKDPVTGKTMGERMAELGKGDASIAKRLTSLKKQTPSAFAGAVENLTEDDVSGLANGEMGQQAVREKLSKLQFTYSDGKQELTIPMDQAIREGRMGGRLKKAWLDETKKMEAASKPETLLALPAAKIDIATLNERNATPEVIAKIASEGTEAQIRALAARPDLKDKVSQAQGALHGKIDKTETANDRLRMRNNLSLMSGGMGGLEAAYDVKEDGSFATDRAREDFKLAMKDKGDQMLDQIDFSDPSSQLAQTAASSIGPAAVQKLIKKFADTPAGPEAEKVKRQVEGLIDTVAQARVKKSGRLNELKNKKGTTAEERKEMGDLSRELAEIEKQNVAGMHESLVAAEFKKTKSSGPLPSLPSATGRFMDVPDERLVSQEARAKQAYVEHGQSFTAAQGSLMSELQAGNSRLRAARDRVQNNVLSETEKLLTAQIEETRKSLASTPLPEQPKVESKLRELTRQQTAAMSERKRADQAAVEKIERDLQEIAAATRELKLARGKGKIKP